MERGDKGSVGVVGDRGGEECRLLLLLLVPVLLWVVVAAVAFPFSSIAG